MDRAVPVIPTSGMYYRYARPQLDETTFILNIWTGRIAGMIHLRPASLLIGLVGISRRTRG
jgi:hypothetical protein